MAPVHVDAAVGLAVAMWYYLIFDIRLGIGEEDGINLFKEKYENM